MNNLNCKHCGRDVMVDDETCPNCSIPLPPNHGKQRQRKFILWFAALVIFCFIMIFWLPPNWSQFMGK